MPVSKKRKKNQSEEQEKRASRNIVKTKWGRVVITILALSFILSGLVGLIYTMILAMNA
ncbi:MAG: hypothetical protein K9L74_01030 [Candidatus Izimaplasma sp.]|nr:hypothetical protein [Candidatus Izimaplasma bacterium]